MGDNETVAAVPAFNGVKSMPSITVTQEELAALVAAEVAKATGKPQTASYPQYQRIDDPDKGTLLRVQWGEHPFNHTTHGLTGWKRLLGNVVPTAVGLLEAWSKEPGFKTAPSKSKSTSDKPKPAPVRVYTPQEIAAYSAAQSKAPVTTMSAALADAKPIKRK